MGSLRSMLTYSDGTYVNKPFWGLKFTYYNGKILESCVGGSANDKSYYKRTYVFCFFFWYVSCFYCRIIT